MSTLTKTRMFQTSAAAFSVAASLALVGCSGFRIASNSNNNAQANAANVEDPFYFPPNPLVEAAGVALTAAHQSDPGLESFFGESYAFAIFPIVMTGEAFGAVEPEFNGRGIVIRDGVQIGEIEAEITYSPEESAAFSQIVFFEDEAAFNNFSGGFQISSDNPTFPVVPGVSTWARFTEGLAVFTSPGVEGIAPTSAGGQSFTFFAE